MYHQTTDQSFSLFGVREGNSYFIVVTGAESAVEMEFQHEEGGAWFPHPDFSGTPESGVVKSHVLCFTPRVRLTLADPQETTWTATWVKQVFETF